VGTSPKDMEFVQMETRHVAGLMGKSGDPSPVTARGVFRALQAAAKQRWGSDDVKGKTVALQGCGNVGYHLALNLHQAGARLIATDVDEAKVDRIARDFGAAAVAPDEIYRQRADVFAPCALGGIINDETIPQLKVEIVAGGANNQLLEARHGDELYRLGFCTRPITPQMPAGSSMDAGNCWVGKHPKPPRKLMRFTIRSSTSSAPLRQRVFLPIKPRTAWQNGGYRTDKTK